MGMSKEQKALLALDLIARELVDDLPTYEDVARYKELTEGLRLIMEEDQLSLSELREKCWDDSTEIFNRIF